MRFLPLAGSTHFTTSAFIQRQLNFVQAARKILFGNIAELEARQRRDSVAQGTQEKLPLQGIAVSRRAIQVIADNGEFHLIRRRQRCFCAVRLSAIRSGIKSSTWKSQLRSKLSPVLARTCHKPVGALISSG